jgi:hypothetical protein
MMLLIALITWLVLLTTFVLLCRMAAAADRRGEVFSAESYPSLTGASASVRGPGVGYPGVGVPSVSVPSIGVPGISTASAGAPGVRGRGGRSRAGRYAAGS